MTVPRDDASDPPTPADALRAAAEADGSRRRPTTVTAYRDGPLIMRGDDVTFLDHDGVLLDPGRRTVALCRCGRSALKPFCDGSHTAARFTSGTSAHRVETGPAEREADDSDQSTGRRKPS